MTGCRCSFQVVMGRGAPPAFRRMTSLLSQSRSVSYARRLRRPRAGLSRELRSCAHAVVSPSTTALRGEMPSASPRRIPLSLDMIDGRHGQIRRAETAEQLTFFRQLAEQQTCPEGSASSGSPASVETECERWVRCLSHDPALDIPAACGAVRR